MARTPDNKILNVLNNRQLYKKAYLIEFYSNYPSTLDEVFTFSVPPESEELTYSQRKTETKTFGGLHVDDYGVDAVKISLSGSTVNQSLKKIYRPGKEDLELTGEDEIYHFRKLLLDYKSFDKLTKYENAKILIYDLSKFSDLSSADKKTIDNYWEAFPGDLKISRSSDRPFTYKYTFEFTGIPTTAFNKYKGLLVKAKDNLNIIEKAMKGLLIFAGWMDTANDWWDDNVVKSLNNQLKYVNQIGDLLDLCGNVMTHTVDSVLYYPNSLGKMAENVLNSATYIMDGAVSITDGFKNTTISLPRAVQLRALNIGIELHNATNRLFKSTASLTEKWRTMFDGIDDFSMPEDIQDMYDMSTREMTDTILIMQMGAENAAAELVAAAKSSEVPESVILGEPDPATGLPRMSLVWGNTSIIPNDTDSFESIAEKYFGDPDKAIDIAAYNGIASLNELELGAAIRLPITTRTVKMANNLIFSRREDRDNYGRDIMLNDDRRIVTSNTGDYELTRGVENLTQAVLLRLRESNSKRIRVNTYGIRSNISDPVAGTAYIMASINQTVNSEPRVESVDDIRFRGRGDTLEVEVFYHDINNAYGKASGRV